MFDTVAGDSPVTPASSTCVSDPRCWTALTIRALLASRSEVWEPGVTRSLPTAAGYTRADPGSGRRSADGVRRLATDRAYRRPPAKTRDKPPRRGGSGRAGRVAGCR